MHESSVGDVALPWACCIDDVLVWSFWPQLVNVGRMTYWHAISPISVSQATIQERMDAGKVTTTTEAAAASAAEMGYGAVKYFDLRQHPTTSYVFRYACVARVSCILSVHAARAPTQRFQARARFLLLFLN